VEICLWGWYWWSSCNGGITFRFSKKFTNLLLNQEIHTCVIHRCALASGTLPTSLKIVLDSTIKLSIPSNLEACTPACFKEHGVNSTHEVLFHPSVRWLSKRNCSKLRSCDNYGNQKSKKSTFFCFCQRL